MLLESFGKLLKLMKLAYCIYSLIKSFVEKHKIKPFLKDFQVRNNIAGKADQTSQVPHSQTHYLKYSL